MKERINTYKTFLKEFLKNKLDECNMDNINKLTVINKNLTSWTVFKADIINIPLIITLTYLEKNLLLLDILKKLSKCIVKNYSPHFQLYYNETNCKNITVYKKLLTDKSSTSHNNYNITFFENLFYDGNLYELINLINIKDKLFINILTQCILAIMFYYSYFSNKKSEFISLEGISGLDFICHRIEKGGYFKYELYVEDYYLENLGYVIVLSFINKKSNNIIIKSKNNFDIIFSFLKTLKIFLEKIILLLKTKDYIFFEKLVIILEKCNNTNKQLPDKLLAKTVNSISNHIIIKDFLELYKGLYTDIKESEVINPNTPYIISETYE